MADTRRELLRRMVQDELDHPEDMQRTLTRLETLWPEMKPWLRFLRLKDERQRALAFLHQERLWYQGFSWWMARMLMLFGLVMMIPAWFDRTWASRIVDMLLGGVLFYVWIWALAQWRYRRRRGRQSQLEAQYREKLTEVLQELRG